MKRILFSAQGFGFGPTAKAAVIASLFLRRNQNLVIDFIGSGTAYELASSRKNIFTNLYTSQQQEIITKRIENRYYNAVISVMEPKVVLIAHLFHVPVFLVDSLYWFWDWPLERIVSLSSLKIQTLKDIGDIFQKIHPHERQFLAHKYASNSYLQACFDAEKASRNMEYIKNQKIIAPIIDTSYVSQDNSHHNTVVLSFCGQFNPVVDATEVLNYCKLILTITRKGFELFLNDPQNHLLIIGHPFVMESLTEIIKEIDFPRVKCQHLCYQDYYKTINSATVIIAPPSLTTFYESRAYGKPLIFLPEQHDGHWPNFKTLTRNEKEPSRVFPGQMLTPFISDLKEMKEGDIKTLYEKIANLLTERENPLLKLLQDTYTRVISNISDATYLADLTQRQELYFENNFLLPPMSVEESIIDMERQFDETTRN